MSKQPIGVRIAPYGIAIICFILPFVELSCAGDKMFTLTGVQLATGAEVNDPVEGKPMRIEPDGQAIVAVLALLVALLACIGRDKTPSLVAAIAGGIASAALLLLKVGIDAEVLKRSEGMPLTVEYLGGYWIALLAAIGGTVLAIGRSMDLNPDNTSNQSRDEESRHLGPETTSGDKAGGRVGD